MAKKKEEIIMSVDEVNESSVDFEEGQAAERKKPVRKVNDAVAAKDVDIHQLVTVRNGFHGQLIYKSKRTNEVYVWEEFGDEQSIELYELRNAKASNKKFFSNNWFMFDDEWIIDYLGVRQFYKNALTIDDFDDVFDKSPDEIREVVYGLSEGQRRSMIYRARQLIADGTIDSHKKIQALESALKTSLVSKMG